MGTSILRIGTRGSELALAQTRMAIAAIHARSPDTRFEIVEIRTSGDRSAESNALPGPGVGVFVRELESALVAGEVDVAVHSLKDVPASLAPKTELAAFLERADPRDVLVSGEGVPLRNLPEGTTVGTSSARRRAQILAARPDLNCVPLCGNVDTRWFSSLPLFGKRILVTRAREQASALVEELAGLGAMPLELPAIRIEPPEDPRPLDDALRMLDRFSWVVFTSTNAAEIVAARVMELGLDLRSFARSRIAAIGSATADVLLSAGLRADIVADRFTAEGLLDTFSGEEMAGKRVLLPRAMEAREALPKGLAGRGAEVEVVEAYRTLPGDTSGPLAGRALEGLREGRVDLLTFASSSAVRNFSAILDSEELDSARAIPTAAIGPITARTAEELGFRVVVQPAEHTIPALVDEIVRWATANRDGAALNREPS